MQEIKRMLKKFRRSGKKSTRITVCPRCGSTKLSLSSKMDAWLTPKRYVCADCGYIGPIAMEIEREEKEKRET
ncbi:hypothetical protein DRO22_02850 [Candidatus Bathyarchaeota archaeon]|nr:MAG: hypothetical protein DRO22_02850 [Candidatus Bathyarchaeota archaeon]